MTVTLIRLVTALLAVAAIGAGDAVAESQIQYATGQNIAPAYEGWWQNPDGTYTMVFGYMNRNYEEELDIPIGDTNRFEPGNPDRGQPTHFYLRRQMYVFEVVVPADWGTKDLIWTVTAHGRTDKAYGTLVRAYELSDFVVRENRLHDMGVGGGERNRRPTITLTGAARRTATLSEPLTLAVTAADDGFPTPRPPRRRPSPPPTTAAAPAPARAPRPNPVTQAVVRPQPEVGLTVTWIHYRGAGKVTFDPQSQPVSGGTTTTKASFSQPGTYVLRAYADDSVLTTTTDVTVVVPN